MKITKESLKKMVIQELTNDYRLGIDDGGEELWRSDFRSTNFEDDIKRITGLLDDMETIVREDKLLKPQDLQYFKNYHLDNLYRKIGFLESAIDARVAGKLDVNE
jgi:hypothetical protein